MLKRPASLPRSRAYMKFGRVQDHDKLANLFSYLGPDGILRVGGRLRRSSISFSKKHPALIPASHPLASVIIEHCHVKSKHQGSHFSHFTVLQEGFHIEGGKRLINKYIKSCVICKKFRGPLSSQLMADLPSDRLAETPPFSDVGIDVFSPFHITRNKATRRSSGTAKCG